MPTHPPDPDVTALLRAWSDGEPDALARLIPWVIDDLRQMARHHFERESPGHTLQPTALVNEVFLRLANQRHVEWENRSQFFGFAARLMRRVLVDHARQRKASKRGGKVAVAPLDEALLSAEARHLDLVALDDALEDLARLDPQGSKIVELRFFVGLTQEEIAEVLGTSVMTVRRQWMAAKVWLYRQLGRPDEP